MRARLLTVGRPRDATADRLHARYVSRLRRLGLPWDESWVAECRVGGKYSDEHAREREARALLERVESKDRLIALDPAGEALDTETVAARLPNWCRPRGVFVIGGPTGLHPRLLERAAFRWSLSPLTFPHELVRVLVAEQLYRALSVRKGLPYHKGSPAADS